jgi:hypothetical protein
MVIMLNSHFAEPMSLSEVPGSVPVIQLHSSMSEGKPLEVEKDELYHTSVQKLREWVGECGQPAERLIPSSELLEPSSAQESIVPFERADTCSETQTTDDKQVRNYQKSWSQCTGLR